MERERPERHRRLVERLEAAAEAEDLRARVAEWRGRSERERSEALARLMTMAAQMNRSRPQPYQKPPLDFPRFSSRRGVE